MKNEFSWEALDKRYESLIPLFDRSKRYEQDNRRAESLNGATTSLTALHGYLKLTDESSR